LHKRNNWLFHDNVEGAKSGAVIFSLIETCKAHGLNVYYYMKYILTEIVNCETVEQLEKLLPFNCAKEVEELQNLAKKADIEIGEVESKEDNMVKAKYWVT